MTPKAIVNAIEARLGVTGQPCEIRDAIERELLESGVTAAAAAEQTDQVRAKVVAEIMRRRDECDESGEIAVLHFRGMHGNIVHGSSFVFLDDSEAIKKAKLNRISVDSIYRHIRGLRFGEFEVLGRSVLRELGCVTAKVTPHAGDQGIDFFGELTVGSLLGADQSILKLMHETRVVLVGQAKHYPDRAIGPSMVRELIGALSLSRTGTYSRDDLDLLDDVELRPFSPVLALLFSTGEFTKGARYLAKRAGLIVFSGWQLAVFLADRGVNLVSSCDQISFEPEAFGA